MSSSVRIAVAMSGGVDSSVAAALLVDAGKDVIGIMLRLWSDRGRENRCCSPADVSRAKQVARKLNIPFYVLDAKAPFKEMVVDFFIDGYTKGITPNPCIECNRSIRWDFLFNRALAMGATHLATGHYGRIIRSENGHQIARAVDRTKDQSYVLSILTQSHLKRTLFPLGEYKKTEVRALAEEYSLPVADKPDSQDLCFVGSEGYRSFLSTQDRRLVESGPIRDPEGKYLGEHSGLFGYTIGQRKGIGLSMPEPLYVLSKEIETNTLTVGPKNSLGRSSFVVDKVNWVSGQIPDANDQISVQVRYKASEVTAWIRPLADGSITVDLIHPLSDVTPGQTAAFYRGEICLGGGIIKA